MRRLSRFAKTIQVAFFLAALAGASAVAQLTPGGAPPSLSGFTPTQGAQGSTVTIIFTGKNFAGKGSLRFGPWAGFTVQNFQVLSSTQISAQVQIDTTAQLGPHGVLLTIGGRNLESTVPFIVTAPAANCGVPGTPACPPSPAPPALRGFSPPQGTQGSNVTVIFTGANFAGAAKAQFAPGAGITVQSTTVVNANEIQAQVAIDPNAPLGARSVLLLLGKNRLAAESRFTVVAAGPKPAPAAAMQILRVIPNQVPAGSQGVDLTLQGTNFVPGTQVTFTVGAGVPAAIFALGPARYVNSTEMHVTVNVLSSALTGGRDINLQTPNQQMVTGKGMLDVLRPTPSVSKGAPPKPKIVPLASQKFPEGKISLQDPKWGTVADGPDGAIENYGIPPLNDETVFEWREQNPGTADYFELRIYASDGKRLVATKHIDDSTVTVHGKQVNVAPTYYRADPAFLSEVLSKADLGGLDSITIKQTPPGTRTNGKLVGIGFGKPLSLTGGTQTQSNNPPQLKPLKMKPASQSDSGPQIPPGDLQWEVAGFRVFNKDGSARGSQNAASVTTRAGANLPASAQLPGGGTPAQQTTLEVEISDRWALSATAFPTGLSSCGFAAASGKGLQPLDLDPEYKAGGPSYPEDLIVLKGDFDLSRSPYATHPGLTQAPAKCGGQSCFQNLNTITEVKFDNLFVDWGDGHVDPIHAKPKDPGTNQWNSNVPLTLPDCPAPPSGSRPQKAPSPSQPDACISHRYNYTGNYTLRVFQLSDQDVQQVQASLVAASVDGPATSPYLGTASLQKLGTKLSGGAASSGQAAINALSSSGPSPSDVAGRAYMITCQAFTVSPVQDPLISGPLHLRGITDPDFPGHDVNSQGGLVKKGVGVVQPLGALGNSGGGQASKVKTPIVQGQQSSGGAGEKGLKPLHPLQPEGGAAAPVAICSACDDSLQAQTNISFVGYGGVQITWHLDGQVIKSETTVLGPSDPRKNLSRQEAAEGDAESVPPTKSAPYPTDWLPLALKPSADHAVWVEAQVVPLPAPPPNLSGTLAASVRTILAPGLGGNAAGAGASAKDKSAVGSQAAQAAQTALSILTPPANTGLPPLKVGFLSPTNHAPSGMGAVQYANAPLAQLVKDLGKQQQKPGSYVSSKQAVYEVTGADPKQPCQFMFPVQDGGSFEVTGLQNHVTEAGGQWNGTGILKISLANDDYAVPITIKGWQVAPNGTVQSGATFDAALSSALPLKQDTPALLGTIDHVRGTAGEVVKTTLSVQPKDNSVTLAQQGGGVPKWPGVEATLTSRGDWYAQGLTLPPVMLADTGFLVQSSDVRLDLSQNDGDAPPAPCESGPGMGGGKQWMGVRLAKATVTPFTFNLGGTGAGSQTEATWALDAYGICGQFDTNQPFHATVEEGSVSFQKIHFVAKREAYEADYTGVDVHVPWLNTDLTGNATLLAGGGKTTNNALSLSGTSKPLNYKNVTMKASNLQFLMLQGVDLAVQADTEWDLSAENKPFAAVKTRMYFGLNGRAYFQQGNPTQDVHLAGTSTLGQTPLDLVSAHLTAPASGTDMLDFAIQTKLHISEVMPAIDVQVNYGMSQPNPGTYVASGPTNSPFTVDLPYPAGQPASEAKIRPTYTGGSGGGDAFSGVVDLAELGGPPVTGEFRLGYRGGHDYWLTRVTIGLGADGVPLIPAPPVMNLYAIRGGLGHNFPLSAFSDAGSLTSQQPSMDNSYVFMAGLRVGMPDQFTYMLDGNLTIEASGPQQGARMDFHAWLLTAQHSGNGTFQGYFQYAANSFDGRLWGGMDFLNGLASFSLGNSANNAAVDLHFGGGSWHIYAGNKNGQRVQAHFIVANANSYLMLGSEVGLAMGGDANFCLCIGDNSVASAYIKGDLDIGVQITPQPHFIGDASADLSAGVCAFDACIDGNVSAQVHLEALPLDMRATASLTIPIPFWNPTVSFTTHLQV